MSLPDVVCVSHVPWANALERPHQVMQRLARDRRVFFIEDPRTTPGRARVSIRTAAPDVQIISLRVPTDWGERSVVDEQRYVVASLARRAGVVAPVVWVYSPRGARAASFLDPSVLVYDCIDDRPGERELLARADLVFTASDPLFEAKRAYATSTSTYPVPSGVDIEHFAPARRAARRRGRIRFRPRRPRAGILGTLDERVDLELIARVAAIRPDLTIDLVGPLDGLSRADLPIRKNVRWLGPLRYDALPALLASWDVALVPWRATESARRVEPASVLACLAAGVPVVTTPLDAVVDRHGGRVPVLVAAVDEFADAIDAALGIPRDVRRIAIDALLARTSWDRSVKVMSRLLAETEMAKGLARLSRLA
jgi:UDP-galactopyranose mutase